MAFATSNVQRSVFGNLNVTRGDWTGTMGDAAGSLTVGGGRVYLAEFSVQAASTPVERVPVSVAAASGNTSTLTIHNRMTVTRGRFLIIHA